MIKMEVFNIDSLKLDDALSLNELMMSNTERFQRFFPYTLAQNTTLEASKNYILQKKEERISKTEFTFAIKEEAYQKVVGLIIIKELDWNKKQGELAYCIDLKFEGKGWMSKAIKEISKYAFNSLNLKTLQIVVHNSNKGSVSVAENCGFIWQQILENEYTPPNEEPLDMELYELVA